MLRVINACIKHKHMGGNGGRLTTLARKCTVFAQIPLRPIPSVNIKVNHENIMINGKVTHMRAPEFIDSNSESRTYVAVNDNIYYSIGQYSKDKCEICIKPLVSDSIQTQKYNLIGDVTCNALITTTVLGMFYIVCTHFH